MNRSASPNGKPRGIEALLRRAAASPKVEEQLRADPIAAAQQAGIELTESERLILGATPPGQLEQMLAGYRVARPERRGFLRRAWAAALALVLGPAVLAGCGEDLEDDNPPPVRGLEPDIPAPTGSRPDLSTTTQQRRSRDAR